MVVAESGARAGMLDGRAPRGNGGPFGAAICRRTVHASMGGCHLGPSARCMAGPYGGGPGVKRGIAMHLQPAPLVGQRGRTLGLSVVGTAIPSLTAYLIGSLLKSRSNLYQLGRSAAAHPRLWPGFAAARAGGLRACGASRKTLVVGALRPLGCQRRLCGPRDSAPQGLLGPRPRRADARGERAACFCNSWQPGWSPADSSSGMRAVACGGCMSRHPKALGRTERRGAGAPGRRRMQRDIGSMCCSNWLQASPVMHS